MNSKKRKISNRLYNSSESMDFMDQAPMPVMPVEYEYARAYVPFQYYTEAFSPQEALMKGTLFPELYQPEYFIKPIPR